MKFSLKIFFAVFLVSASITTVSALLVMRIMTAHAEGDYVRRYQAFSAQVGSTLIQLDGTTDMIMRNALYVLRERERGKGLLSNADLMKLKKDLGVETLYIVDNRGKYVRSDWYLRVANDPRLKAFYGAKGPLTKSLFSYCADYKRLTDASGPLVQQTPIVPSGADGWPYKFVMIPNHDRTRILEADMAMRFIGDILKNVVASDPGVSSIGLFTPTGAALGYVESGGKLPAPAAPLDTRNIQYDGPISSDRGFVFYSKVPAATTDCCECRLRGLAAADGDYYYLLRTVVSRKALNARLAGIRRLFFWMILVALGLSAALAFLISSRLVARLRWMGEKVGEIADSGAFDRRLRLPGSDEVSALARRFDGMMQQLQGNQARLASAEHEKAFVELARQVAHDIRSPLAALDTLVRDASALPESRRVIVRGAVNRIHDIANDLLARHKGSRPRPAADATAHLLSSLIDSIVTEKRLQYRGRMNTDISAVEDEGSYGLFATVQPAEFKRVISNLIDNAVEALGDNAGAVQVSVSAAQGQVFVRVSDNGKGIPAELLSRLGRKGETHGKSGGYGLGLSHAVASVESWGGRLSISSEVGGGTEVSLSLPAATPPSWFVSHLELEAGSFVVILDDDASIHQVWQSRLTSLGRPLNLVHLSNAEQLQSWLSANEQYSPNATYLIDYELAVGAESGLALIEKLGLESRAILVTSRFEEEGVLSDCLRLGVRMIPKGLAGSVPVTMRPGRGEVDAVLIDDDRLVRMIWTVSAKAKGKNILAVAHPQELAARIAEVPKSTPIYIDCDLGAGLRGEDLARKLHANGFENLYLATGDVEAAETGPWLKGVRGKAPPWS